MRERAIYVPRGGANDRLQVLDAVHDGGHVEDGGDGADGGGRDDGARHGAPRALGLFYQVHGRVQACADGPAGAHQACDEAHGIAPARVVVQPRPDCGRVLLGWRPDQTHDRDDEAAGEGADDWFGVSTWLLPTEMLHMRENRGSAYAKLRTRAAHA
jgi:hypothetical protein